MDLPQERRLVTEIPGPASRELMERRRNAVPSGIAYTVPIFVRAASGAVVEDVDGNRFIDLGAGIAVTNAGNDPPEVVDAIAEQADRFLHTCFAVVGYEPYVALAERLNAITPGDHDKRTMLANSGAEAVENAVKIARYYTKRQAVVVFDHAFHGRTLLAMSMTAKVDPYKHGFPALAPELYRLPASYPYRCAAGAAPEDCGPACADMVIDRMKSTIGADQIAAVVLEPIQGEGGFVVPGKGFLPELREFCKQNGIVFVADEVQTGMGRTGRWFGIEHEGVVPDIVTTAKALGGGLPISGITGSVEIMNSVHTGGLGTTFGGNPVACASALATIDKIEREGLVERAAYLEGIIAGRLRDLADRHPIVGDVRGRGAMVAMELVTDRRTKEPAKDATTKVLDECHRNGVLALKAGTYDNVIRLLPPLTIDEGLLDEGMTIIEKAVATVG